MQFSNKETDFPKYTKKGTWLFRLNFPEISICCLSGLRRLCGQGGVKGREGGVEGALVGVQCRDIPSIFQKAFA